jgi:hypothetical protein
MTPESPNPLKALLAIPDLPEIVSSLLDRAGIFWHLLENVKCGLKMNLTASTEAWRAAG